MRAKPRTGKKRSSDPHETLGEHCHSKGQGHHILDLSDKNSGAGKLFPYSISSNGLQTCLSLGLHLFCSHSSSDHPSTSLCELQELHHSDVQGNHALHLHNQPWMVLLGFAICESAVASRVESFNICGGFHSMDPRSPPSLPNCVPWILSRAHGGASARDGGNAWSDGSVRGLS